MSNRSNFFSSTRIRASVSGLCLLCLAALPVQGDDGEQGECVMPIDATTSGTLLTRTEKIELLNKRFYEALARFEECMQGSAGGGAGGQGAGSSGGQAAGAAIDSVAVSSVQGTEQPVSSEAASETIYNPQPTELDSLDSLPNGQLPEQLESSDNDAILLEQIRQAAIAEEDPELKKKLWQEYEKRKTAAGGS